MRKLWIRLVQCLMTLAVPVLLFVVTLRLATGAWFVRWEYGREGFPPDPYGLSKEERVRLGEICVDYLATGADITLLSEQRLADGRAAFNERELRHMEDVQAVYGGLMASGIVAGIVVMGGALLLVARCGRRSASRALLGGGLVSLGLLAAVGAYMAIGWESFFTNFHRIFFAEGTWTFWESDTLIRLFPMRFWMDIAVVIVGLLIIEAVAVSVAGWVWGRLAG